MPTLWIASANAKKGRELERLLAPLGYAVRLQSEASPPISVAESAPDFAGNAALKATALARAVRAFAIGDDSGLCVDALNGAPGVHSARYAGANATDADRIAKLLGALADVPEPRRARFVCHVCLAAPSGEIVARFEDTCRGVILRRPSGSGGFGYDPLFVADAHLSRPDRPTFAELTDEQKDQVSHRGKALRRLVEHLRRHPLPQRPTCSPPS